MLSVGLTAVFACASNAGAQVPWNLTIKPSASPLVVGVCTPVRLELFDASGKDAPRNPTGNRISIADFDMSVAAATAGAVVGRYDGASAWSACPCPGAAGAMATVTATYPARSIDPKALMKGVSFKTSITVPVVAAGNSGTPIGCELLKTTTVRVTTATASPGLGTGVPWTVTLGQGVTALPIGVCTPIRLDLRDATGKEEPRNPAGQLLTLKDFDMTVAANSGAVVGTYDGTIWSACVCQGAAVGTPATITATYPAHALAPAARVPGVVFQSSMTIPLTAARGTANPQACGA